MKQAAKVITRLQITPPSEWKGKSGWTWHALITIEPIRNIITHGFRTTDPEKLRLATKIVLALLEDHSWLASVMVPSRASGDGSVPIGSILQPRVCRRDLHSKSLAELCEILDVSRQGDEIRGPSIKDLEHILQRLQD
jgi:hypothetical protein